MSHYGGSERSQTSDSFGRSAIAESGSTPATESTLGFGKIEVEMERLAKRTAPERGKCQTVRVVLGHVSHHYHIMGPIPQSRAGRSHLGIKLDLPFSWSKSLDEKAKCKY